MTYEYSQPVHQPTLKAYFIRTKSNKNQIRWPNLPKYYKKPSGYLLNPGALVWYFNHIFRT